jgi:hypothetical protein
MIQCMPFSYLSDSHIRCLSTLMGPFGVCQVAEVLVPASMRVWAEQGRLALLFPQGVDLPRLQRVMAEHRQWAQLHAGQLWDRVGAALAADGRPPLVDENSVSQLSTRIRRYGEEAKADGTDPLMHAALFMAICQEHDQQQEAAERDLASVQAMEQAMFARLSGETADAPTFPTFEASPGSSTESLSAEMIERCLRAWAIASRRVDAPPDACITCSGQVFEALRERFTDAADLGTWSIDAGAARGDWPAILRQIAMAADPIPAARQLLNADQPQPAGPSLVLAVIPGCPPGQMMGRLGAGGPTGTGHLPVWSEPPHTVLGLVAGCGVRD